MLVLIEFFHLLVADDEGVTYVSQEGSSALKKKSVFRKFCLMLWRLAGKLLAAPSLQSCVTLLLVLHDTQRFCQE
jgi:hypothetical protein